MRRRGDLGLAAAAFALLLGCRGGTQTPEAGALLLQVDLAAGAPAPDELRLWAYDDSGVLWSNARFPAEGPLVPQSASVLGTILLEPGTTLGDLRIDLRGVGGGVVIDEGLLTLSPAARAAGRFDVSLSAALPSDGDGDGVPDPIDDCPAAADPAQTGCRADGGAADSAVGKTDAGGDGLPQGAACQAAAQCRSGFCKDGACCDGACTDPCNSCATGTCTPITSGEDAPECVAPMSCNKKGKCVGN